MSHSHPPAIPETSFHNHQAGKVTRPVGLRSESEHEVPGAGLAASSAGTIRCRPLLPASQEPPLQTQEPKEGEAGEVCRDLGVGGASHCADAETQRTKTSCDLPAVPACSTRASVGLSPAAPNLCLCGSQHGPDKSAAEPAGSGPSPAGCGEAEGPFYGF
uniref:Uncharacterized protein n=1 Tax=Rousettus aegyptiacus TaxID=9407 RepID=A0A7J8BEJ3_ROUAE|nr:hypothetical protein HJG63_009791 [Rousettus aegyptiacus]